MVALGRIQVLATQLQAANGIARMIVGGLKLVVGGVLVDGSVRFLLSDLRRELRSAPVEAAASS